jgi:hypothetical protein
VASTQSVPNRDLTLHPAALEDRHRFFFGRERVFISMQFQATFREEDFSGLIRVAMKRFAQTQVKLLPNDNL